MHEVAIMEQAVSLAIEAANKAGATRIASIRLRIGELAGVVPEALEFAFEAVTRGTIAEGGKMSWENVPVRCWCPTCEAEFHPEGSIFECPTCGLPSADIRAGRELHLVDVEVESGD